MPDVASAGIFRTRRAAAARVVPGHEPERQVSVPIKRMAQFKDAWPQRRLAATRVIFDQAALVCTGTPRNTSRPLAFPQSSFFREGRPRGMLLCDELPALDDGLLADRVGADRVGTDRVGADRVGAERVCTAGREGVALCRSGCAAGMLRCTRVA